MIGWVLWIAGLLVHGPHREFELGDLDESLRRTARDRGSLAVLKEGVGVLVRLAVRRTVLLVSEVVGDVRLALRQCVRAPRVFLGGAAVLAVGLGVGAFAWGVPYGMFDRGLEVERPDRFIVLGTTTPFRSEGPFATQTRWGFQLSDRDLLDGIAGLDMVGLWTDREVNWVDGTGPAARPSATIGSPLILSELELETALGRLLVPADTAAASLPVAVIAHAYWAARFGEDPSVVGRLVQINGTQTEIVGVLERGAGFPVRTDVWLPHNARTLGDSPYMRVMGRMSEGATIPAIVSQLQSRLDALPADRREAWSDASAFGRPFTHGFRTGPNLQQLRLLTRAGALLMIMALANVANLFLVRAQTRTRELAVRRALGASRARILRQLSAEAAIPAVLGFLGGVGIASYGLAFYAASWEGGGYTWWVWALEWRHVVFLAATAVLSTVVVTLIVGVHELRRAGATALRTARGSEGKRFRLGYGLVGIEVAVGSALLLVAALMVQSGWTLRTIDWGFETESVMTGRIALEGDAYETPEARQAFWEALQLELEAEPGVVSATVTTQLPFIRAGGLRSVEVEGEAVDDWRNLPRRYGTAATPSFFETFDVPLVSGRNLEATDEAEGVPVVVVNTDFARTHFPDGEVMGRRLRIWTDGEPGPWRTVVGVAPHLWMDTEENRFPQGFYMPLAQFPTPSASIAVRVEGPAESFRGGIAEVAARLDADLPVDEVRTMSEVIRARTRLYRQAGPMFSALGFFALFLSVLGLYAVLSYLTSLRTTEFGIRTALGATSRELVGRGVRRGALPVLAGITVGVSAGLTLVRDMQRFLFEVEPNDPWVTFMSVAVLLVTCAVASAIPAWRASRVDPSVVLQGEG